MATPEPRHAWAGWRWKLGGVGVLVLAIAAGVWLIQRQQHGQRLEACRQLRQEIAGFKAQVFDVRMQRMRSVRLNDTQAATLRQVDANAFARYVGAYGETVDQVAQAADQLAGKVERYRTAACFDLR